MQRFLGAVALATVALTGPAAASEFERNIFTGLVGNTSFRDDRVVPVLELELGFGWQSESGRVRCVKVKDEKTGRWIYTDLLMELDDSSLQDQLSTQSITREYCESLPFGGSTCTIQHFRKSIVCSPSTLAFGQ